MRLLWLPKISAHHLSRAGLAGVFVAAAVVVFAAALVVRVLIAPLSLGPFTGQLRTSLAQAVRCLRAIKPLDFPGSDGIESIS